MLNKQEEQKTKKSDGTEGEEGSFEDDKVGLSICFQKIFAPTE